MDQTDQITLLLGLGGTRRLCFFCSTMPLTTDAEVLGSVRRSLGDSRCWHKDVVVTIRGSQILASATRVPKGPTGLSHHSSVFQLTSSFRIKVRQCRIKVRQPFPEVPTGLSPHSSVLQLTSSFRIKVRQFRIKVRQLFPKVPTGLSHHSIVLQLTSIFRINVRHRLLSARLPETPSL